MKKSLGIDLGTNSLGWAILDNDEGKILNKGVIVFPEATDEKDTVETPAAARRKARAARRLIFRRKLRKWYLLKVLIENGMCPLKPEELEKWKKEDIYPLENLEFLEWLKIDPYKARSDASEKEVTPYELGRALYHLSQRRGFKSSRKDVVVSDIEGGEGKKGKEQKEPKDDLGKVKSGISDLSKELEKSGCKTLGQYFYKIIKDEKNELEKTRIRNRYIGRVEHYEPEFKTIMQAQGIDGDLYQNTHSAIFMQRPLRSQKHLVGKCPLEPKHTRCQLGHPAYEEFRMLSFVNNLRFVDENDEKSELSLKDKERIYKLFDKVTDRIKFSDISKEFKKDFKLNGKKFHYYRDNETVAGCPTKSRIRKALGDSWTEKDEQKIFDACLFFEDNDKLIGWVKKHYPSIPQKDIPSILKIKPKDGFADYSLKAIKNILPWLRKGHNLYKAKLLAKFPEIIPDFDNREEEILNDYETIHSRFEEDKKKIKEDARYYCKPFTEQLKDYFTYEYKVSEEDWNKLYIDHEYEKLPQLPEVELGNIKNPVANRSLTALKKLVNYLLEGGEIDSKTVVRVELARDINNYARRKAIQKWQKDKEEARENARKRIEEYNVTVTDDTIERYILWEEQGHICLYTGSNITPKDLFDGKIIDIEHTVPRSIGGDDSLANKTVCFSKYNRAVKRDKIPSELDDWDEIDNRLRPWRDKVSSLEEQYTRDKERSKKITDPDSKKKAMIKVHYSKMELDYWKDKLWRFDIPKDKLKDPVGGISGFKKRQLVDTGIVTTYAVELLKKSFDKVYPVNGVAVAFARKAWGLPPKNRIDHRHHAVDAMVIAALSQKRFNDICSALKNEDQQRTNRRISEICPPPFEGVDFVKSIEKAKEEICVRNLPKGSPIRQSKRKVFLANASGENSHKKVLSGGSIVRNSLHDATVYGCIKKPGTDENIYVIRRTLIGAKINDIKVDDIVDGKIRTIVKEALVRLSNSGKNTISEGDIKMPSGVAINKVRMKASLTTPLVLKPHIFSSNKDYKKNYYVDSAHGSNFRVAVFEKDDGKRILEADSLLAWAKGRKTSPGDKKFLGYIYPGSMVMAPGDYLYKIVKFELNSDKKGVKRIAFVFHSETRPSAVLNKELKEMGKNAQGESNFDNMPSERLLLSPKQYLQMLYEGIDFKMNLDGEIELLDANK